MQEIKSSEVNEAKAPKVENYRNIQPENGTTVPEAKEYWDKKLNNPDSEEQDKREYRDDNGNLYRVGDELIPDNEYTINGYKYETDSNSRIVSAEGNLQVKDHEGRRDMDSRQTVDKGIKKFNGFLSEQLRAVHSLHFVDVGNSSCERNSAHPVRTCV